MKPSVAIALSWTALVLVGVATLLWRDYRKTMHEVEIIERMWRRTP